MAYRATARILWGGQYDTREYELLNERGKLWWENEGGRKLGPKVTTISAAKKQIETWCRGFRGSDNGGTENHVKFSEGTPVDTLNKPSPLIGKQANTGHRATTLKLPSGGFIKCRGVRIRVGKLEILK